jgi:hypothetical protein
VPFGRFSFDRGEFCHAHRGNLRHSREPPGAESGDRQVGQEQVDGVVVGGNVLPGPMPVETLERLQDLDVPVQYIYGNGEVAVLEQLAGRDPTAGRLEGFGS